jgi:hypothetical protein
LQAFVFQFITGVISTGDKMIKIPHYCGIGCNVFVAIVTGI